MGVDTSTLQNSWACRRVQTFFRREGLLVKYLTEEEEAARHRAVRDLQDTIGEGLEDPKVRECFTT